MFVGVSDLNWSPQIEAVERLEETRRELDAKQQELERLRSQAEQEPQEAARWKDECLQTQAQLERFKADSSLEHRKEKAGLEARLQLALGQVKTMQEKVVSLTFSAAGNQLEHKVAVLGADLKQAKEANQDLERRLHQQVGSSNASVVGPFLGALDILDFY